MILTRVPPDLYIDGHLMTGVESIAVCGGESEMPGGVRCAHFLIIYDYPPCYEIGSRHLIEIHTHHGKRRLTVDGEADIHDQYRNYLVFRILTTRIDA